jgi:hypothetical protein
LLESAQQCVQIDGLLCVDYDDATDAESPMSGELLEPGKLFCLDLEPVEMPGMPLEQQEALADKKRISLPPPTSSPARSRKLGTGRPKPSMSGRRRWPTWRSRLGRCEELEGRTRSAKAD